MFPMQDGPWIPWWLAARIYLIYSEGGNSGQSLERIAERGGFGWSELPVFCDQYKKKFGERQLNDLLMIWREGPREPEEL